MKIEISINKKTYRLNIKLETIIEILKFCYKGIELMDVLKDIISS
jgi:hypothetical protein